MFMSLISIPPKKVHTFKDGSFRPTCVNHGCQNPVTLSSGSVNGPISERTLRTVCSPCHNASYGKVSKKGKVSKLKKGVRSHKKTYCENVDGRIDGHPCTATNLTSAQLELDHKDGNHLNNDPSNVQTLCKNCHSKKSIQAGDYRKACKSHSSPFQKVSNLEPTNDYSPSSKSHPNWQMSNPCSSEIYQSQILNSGDTQPTCPFD